MRNTLIAAAVALVALVVWALARRRPTSPIHPLMHVPVPWVYMLTYLTGVGLQYAGPIAGHNQGFGLAARYVGIIAIVIGSVLAFSALGIFRARRTTTVPFEQPSTLVTSGPYRFTRNPMYVGLALIYLGVAATRAELWPVVLLPLLLLYINGVVIPVEERRLSDVFGESYRAYQTKVRRWL